MTRRQQLAALIQDGKWSVKELAEELGVPIRTIVDDLEHIGQTHRGKMTIEPAACQKCKFAFRDRARVTTPSRCPKCHSEWVRDPRVHMKKS